jgi:N-acyl amino acid synthase of PEP-CTERM/exosortase system
MNITNLFKLLTEKYSLKLVQNSYDIEQLKEVRQKVLLPKYEAQTHIEDIDKFLYNQDDEQSFIYILVHNPTKKPVGTIRIFFINNKTPIQKLPMQIYGGVDDIDYYTQEKPICEISRLALIKDLPKDNDNISALKLRTMLTIGLQSAIAINMYMYDYKMVFSIMEPSLYRLLHRYGINFEAIGKEVDYFGPRIPHAIDRIKLMSEADKTLWQIALHYLKQLAQNPKEFITYIDNHPYLDIQELNLDRLQNIFKQNANTSVDDLLSVI